MGTAYLQMVSIEIGGEVDGTASDHAVTFVLRYNSRGPTKPMGSFSVPVPFKTPWEEIPKRAYEAAALLLGKAATHTHKAAEQQPPLNLPPAQEND